MSSVLYVPPTQFQTHITDLTFMKATTAYALKKAWPELTLHIVPDAGHSSREPGTAKLLVEVRRSVFTRLALRTDLVCRLQTRSHRSEPERMGVYVERRHTAAESYPVRD